MKAFSSPESAAGGNVRSFSQSGLPLNNWASHQTSPASIASRSVGDMLGSARCAQRKIGALIQSRRREARLIDCRSQAKQASFRGRPKAENPESITTTCGYGFQAR